MRKNLKYIIIIISVVILIPFLLLLFINTPPGRYVVSQLATKFAEREINFSGYLYPLSSLFPGIYVSELTVANNSTQKKDLNLADIGEAKLFFSGTNLLSGGIEIQSIFLKDSKIFLERDKAGNANWALGASTNETKSEPLELKSLFLENSTFTYEDVLQNTNLFLKGNSKDKTLTLTGDGKHHGRIFNLKSMFGDSCLSASAEHCSIDAQLNIGYTKFSAKGSVSSLVPLSDANFDIEIIGADAADLFPLLGIALPPTPPYSIKGKLSQKWNEWQFNKFFGKMGSSDISGSASMNTQGVRPKITANLVSKRLLLADLAALIGIAPQKAISEEQKARASQQAASPLIIPNLPLDIEKISSLDARVTFTGKQVVSQDFPLEDFYLNLNLKNKILKLEPVRFGTANGDVTTYMTINAQKLPVQNHADITFSKLKLSKLLDRVGDSIGKITPATGFIGGKIKLDGKGKSLHEMLSDASGVAGIGMEGGSISHLLMKLISLDIMKSLGLIISGDESLAIRCLVGNFGIKKGTVTTNSFVFDTSDSQINIKGGLNLANETLNMQIIPSPKSATLLSLRSPINVTGTLKAPNMSIEKGPIAARGVIAASIAAVVPIAVVAAFFDTGQGEDANCAALINKLHTDTKTTDDSDAIPANK